MFPFCNPWCGGDSCGGGIFATNNNSTNNILTIPPSSSTPNSSESLRRKRRQQQFREDFVVVKLQELVDCKTKQQAEDILLEIDSCIREDDDDGSDAGGDSNNSILLDVLESLGSIYIIHDLLNHPDDAYRRPSPDIAAPLLYKLLARVEEDGVGKINSAERNNGQPTEEEEEVTHADDDSLIQDRDKEVVINNSARTALVPSQATNPPCESSNFQQDESQPQQSTTPWHDSISIPKTTTKERNRTLIKSYTPSSSTPAPYLLPAMTNNRTVL